MNWLNYHHLQYFWVVAKEGSIQAASRSLNLTQPTISKQIKLLEESLGEQLFERTGRRLELTDAGRLALEYAEEIFHLGNEFQESLKGVATTRPKRIRVGASDSIPKLILHRILSPILEEGSNIHLICEEGQTNKLLAELSIQRLDLVLTDAPIRGGIKVKAFNHYLGDSGMSFFAAPKLAKQLTGSFPKNMDGAPYLALTDDTVTRRSFDHWFENERILPQIVAEFHDSALLKVFGREGVGVFASPTTIADEVCREYGVEKIGETEHVRESFYAITVERKVKHAAIAMITERARTELFNIQDK